MKLAPRQIEFVVYLVGLLVLGFVQAQVRRALGDVLSLVCVIAYLIAVRGLGVALVKVFALRESGK